MTSWIDWLGLSASSLATIAFLPQLVKLLLSRSSAGVSILTYLLLACGSGLWLAYDLVLEAWALVLANAVTLVLAVAIVVLTRRYRVR